MSFRRIFSVALASLLSAVGAGLFNPAQAGSVSFTIDADTSSLFPGAGGLIVLAMDSANPPSSPTVSASVSLISTDGVLGGVYPPVIGSAAGDLFPGDSVTMNNGNSNTDPPGYSELDQIFSVGTTLDLSVTLSGSAIGGNNQSGTAFYFEVLDIFNNTESATLPVYPNGQIFPSSSPGVTVIPQAGSVPEPSSFVLLGLGLGVFAVAGRFLNRRAA